MWIDPRVLEKWFVASEIVQVADIFRFISCGIVTCNSKDVT